ncbi:hypothetical protein AB0J90_15205 [Micromonospora sp. NPDC049523]|uniref:hypothetical protein n=1 Tax=Micromonospora sp. NPDC049523 TaxID=3155921 RepID=UPI00344801C8
MPSERWIAELGLSEALDRLQHRIAEGTGSEHLIPFAEALQWVYSLHEYHRLTHPDFFNQAAAHPAGETLGAIVYARGLLTHRMADVTRLIGSRPFRLDISRLGGGDTLGGSGIQVYWANLAALPAPGRPERHSRDVFYDRHLSGVPLLEPFGPVHDWLTGRPEPSRGA